MKWVKDVLIKFTVKKLVEGMKKNIDKGKEIKKEKNPKRIYK